jgi:hypothetical protein
MACVSAGDTSVYIQKCNILVPVRMRPLGVPTEHSL